MKITHGLSSFQVLQRDGHNRGSVSFGGECRTEGEVRARILHGRKPVAGFAGRKVGVARAGAWEGRVSGLPVGGPYTVELEIRPRRGKPEKASVRDILVGDIWVMAGQSNMEGQGNLVDSPRPHPLVHQFAKRCEWELASEPTHFWLESPFEGHWYGMNEEQWREAVAKPQPERDKGASPGLAFGRAMVEETGVPVGLLPTALGGSSMEQWNPDYRETRGTRLLYASMLEYVKRAGGTPVAGVLWWQGESEAFLDTLIPPFHDAFLRLVEAMRADLNDPSLPFIYVQISRVCGMGVDWKLWNAVQEVQRKAADEIPRSACVASVDLPLDDGIHVSGYGQNILGIRLAKAALDLRFGKELGAGPRLDRVELFGPENKLARVRFKGFNGKLSPERHVAGFSLRNPAGDDLSLVFEAHPDPDNPGAVILHLDATPPADAQAWYGWGRNPYCNLVDEEGMAALTFGPVPLVKLG